MDEEKYTFRINMIGHNEKGLIGFIDGTYELVYLQKPKNWEEVVEKLGLPYISKENVKEVNKAGKEAYKNVNKRKAENSDSNVGRSRKGRTR